MEEGDWENRDSKMTIPALGGGFGLNCTAPGNGRGVPIRKAQPLYKEREGHSPVSTPQVKSLHWGEENLRWVLWRRGRVRDRGCWGWRSSRGSEVIHKQAGAGDRRGPRRRSRGEGVATHRALGLGPLTKGGIRNG